MSLFETIEDLKLEQLCNINNFLCSQEEQLENLDLQSAQNYLKQKLIDYYNYKTNQEFSEPSQIIALWRDYVHQIVKKKNVKDKNQNLKQDILKELTELDLQDSLNDSSRIVNLVRDILILLYKELDERERKKYIEIIRKDLEAHSQRLTDEELKILLNNSFLDRIIPWLAMLLIADKLSPKIIRISIVFIVINSLVIKPL